jgi:Protein of unknown function (DUF3035)
MSGYIRREFSGRTSLLVVACIATITGLAGCTGFKQMIGLDQPAPDEFAVESRAPLTIPPEFDLRPPKPGAPRPQEVTAAERARKVIDAAGPGKPGDQANSALLPETVGAQVDPDRALGANSLASKLLGSNDSSSGGTVGKRETQPLKGVY